MGSESGTKITNTFNPTISIDAAPRSESSSNSSVSIKGISLTETLNAIRNIDGIDSGLKDQALKAAKDLDAASSTRDQMTFSEKLEKLASLAKSSSDLAKVLLPLAMGP